MEVDAAEALVCALCITKHALTVIEADVAQRAQRIKEFLADFAE